MRKRLAWLIALTLVTASCSTGSSSAGARRATPARTSAAVLVEFHPVDQDGMAYDAGRIIAAAVARALEPKLATVDLIEAPSEAAALQNASRSGAQLLFVPTIEQWEDHESKWAATRPDLLTVQIRLHDVATGDLLASVKYKAEGRQQYLSGNPAIEEMLGDKFRKVVVDLLRY